MAKRDKKKMYENLSKEKIENLLNIIMLKNRRGKIVIKYSKKKDAVNAFDVAVKTLRMSNNAIVGNKVHKDIPGPFDHLSNEKFDRLMKIKARHLFGRQLFVDEALKRASASKSKEGITIVYGTGGSLDGNDYFNELWKNAERPFVASIDTI